MKKLLTLALAVLMLASLAACATPSEQPSQAPSPEPAESVPSAEPATPEESATKVDVTILDGFVDDNQVYFDLHVTADSVKDFSLKVGSETLSESKKIAFNSSDTITLNGEPVEGKKFTIYIIRKFSDAGSLSLEHFIHVGVRADKLGEMLGKVYERLGTSTSKAYITVLETNDGWNHDLSPKLNDYLNAIKPSDTAA